ncbi:urea carboxylase-associated family protein [Luteolibacter yonseiensis]|uniref:Urea carboxylase-associated family protein n=1 Tax=Luteolibacter yonseiensis TaxID=1144680 RepID=A0A934R2Z3_9BACT|nr:urea amidolyase associated protein UAAP1 [Luteolibacter yonseiensis]MBK1815341.1 urea carboxylase-associated family protein [Luteolibacter yonseiensis]
MKPLFEKTLSGAGMWSAVISRGKRLRLTDTDGGANVGMLLYNTRERTERYNMPDTLKGQHIFYLRSPYCLHSDMGRLLASVTSDTVGWHDTVCGHSDAARVLAKYGENNYQSARNGWHRNGHDCFLIELAKWGLGKKDLVPNLNLFSKAVADEAGQLTFVPENSKPGDSIELRFEMDTLVVLNTCQHPLDPDPVYRQRQVKLQVFAGDPPADDDPSLLVRPENLRAWENNQTYHTLLQP